MSRIVEFSWELVEHWYEGRREGVMKSEDPARQEPDFNDDYEDGGASGCNTCGGEGWIVICIDDLCRGAGECMHGDGEIPCPDCDGALYG